MDGRHPRPRLFGPAGEFGRVQRRLVPAETHLDGHWNLHRLDHRGYQTLGVIEIAHQRRAGQRARYPPRRATHIDVDERSACADDPSRGLGQRPRFPTDELDGVGSQSVALGAHRRFCVAVKIGLGCDHLREDERRPETARDPPHRQIAHPRHRREQRRPSSRIGPMAMMGLAPKNEHTSFCLQSSQLNGEGKPRRQAGSPGPGNRLSIRPLAR